MIINYLIEQLLNEARFGLVSPEDFKYYGLESIEVLETEDDRVINTCVGPYIFVFKDNLYDMDLETTLLYPHIRTESGGIRYDVYSNKIKPMYVDIDGMEYELTDTNIKNNPHIGEFIDGISSQLIVDVIIDFSFDLSESDPSYDPTKQFAILNNGSSADVYRKLNNVAYILKDYLTYFNKYVVKPLIRDSYGSKYKIFTSNLKYYLTNITFNAKEEFEGDMRRTNVYKRWFEVVAPSMGNVVKMEIRGSDFNTTFADTRLS